MCTFKTLQYITGHASITYNEVSDCLVGIARAQIIPPLNDLQTTTTTTTTAANNKRQ